MQRVTDVKALTGHRLWIRFDDGAEGEVDLSAELWGEVFEPLLVEAEFAKVRVHEELATVCWPNGADFAPEFLYARVVGTSPRSAVEAPAQRRA